MNVACLNLIGLIKLPKVALRMTTRVILWEKVGEGGNLQKLNENKSCSEKKLGTANK